LTSFLYNLIFIRLLIAKIKVMAGENDRWEFYQDNRSEWRWRRIASNGQIVGASSEGYTSRQNCVENARRNGYKE
jgi:uncharacterized protein YegP (UPF0339 family)